MSEEQEETGSLSSDDLFSQMSTYSQRLPKL